MLHSDPAKFQDFLRRNFKGKFIHYKDMRPVANQPGKLDATTKTHKSNSPDEITVENLRFRPTILQVGTFTYNAAQVITNYLKPLCQNKYKIANTQSLPSMLKEQTPLILDEEYVLDDLESLFTNIPVDETISYIIYEIYQRNTLPQIYSTVILKRFQFNYNLLKQTNGCTMGGPSSVTLADIHRIRMETDVVVPIKPIFYNR